jgi:hypothetical protein
MLEDDLVEPDVEFLGDQHCFGGVDALSHFGVWHDQADRACAVDPDEGVRRESGVTVGGRSCGLAGLGTRRYRGPGLATAAEQQERQRKPAACLQDGPAGRTRGHRLAPTDGSGQVDVP